MNKKAVFFLVGPQGIGKTAAAQRIVNVLGCDQFRDLADESDGPDPKPGTLYLSNDFALSKEVHEVAAEFYRLPSVMICIENNESLNSFIKVFSSSAAEKERAKERAEQRRIAAERLSAALTAISAKCPPNTEGCIIRACTDIAEALEQHGYHSPEYEEAVEWASKTLKVVLPLLLANCQSVLFAAIN